MTTGSRIPDLHRTSHLVAVNSNGTVFDTMEILHRKVFVPTFCETYELEHLHGLVEEVWSGICLYGRQRGLNRFPAFVRLVTELHGHPVLKRFPGVLAAILPWTEPVQTWIERTATLSNESLEREIHRQSQLMGIIDHGRGEIREALEELERLLRWSNLVNQRAATLLPSIPPFASAVNFMRMLRPSGDDAADPTTCIIGLSQAPRELTLDSWNRHGISTYVDAFHTQEDGPTVAILKRYVREGGFTGKLLMVGDSPTDLETAQAIGASFFPILPGHEFESWEKLCYEAWPIFATGNYTVEYQARLVNTFFIRLSEAAKPQNPVEKM